MPDDKLQLPSEALAAARLSALQLARSFATVIGHAGRRSEDQSRVMAHLESCAAEGLNSYQFNSTRDGVALIAAGIHRDGAKSLLNVISSQLHKAAAITAKAKPKPDTKR